MAAEYERTLPAGAASRMAPQGDDRPIVQPEQQEMLTDPSSKFELLNPLGRIRQLLLFRSQPLDKLQDHFFHRSLFLQTYLQVAVHMDLSTKHAS